MVQYAFLDKLKLKPTILFYTPSHRCGLLPSFEFLKNFTNFFFLGFLQFASTIRVLCVCFVKAEERKGAESIAILENFMKPLGSGRLIISITLSCYIQQDENRKLLQRIALKLCNACQSVSNVRFLLKLLRDITKSVAVKMF